MGHSSYDAAQDASDRLSAMSGEHRANPLVHTGEPEEGLVVDDEEPSAQDNPAAREIMRDLTTI